MSADRDGFESHMRKLNPCVRLHRQQHALGGRYRTVTVQRAWDLWQAARMAQAEREEAAVAVLREFSQLYGNLWDSADKDGWGLLSPQSCAAYDAVHAKAHAILEPALKEVQP